MFEHWDNFYLMIGSAAGALIGLLIVVATLTGGLEREKAMQGSALYMTPTVFHFAVVLVASAVTAVPHLTARASAGLLGLVAIIGLIYSASVAHRLRRRATPEPAHRSDFWCHGCAPGVIYVAQLAAAAALAFGVSWAPDALGAALLSLLLLAIRNAWDLVTWLAPGAAQKR